MSSCSESAHCGLLHPLEVSEPASLYQIPISVDGEVC